MGPVLSILIPSIPSRVEKYLLPLFKKLEGQAENRPVEILSLLDNKKRSIGLKRQSLVSEARGEYITFVDDDDDVSDDYVDQILRARAGALFAPDVITFDQVSSIDGKPFKVSFGLNNVNQEAGWLEVDKKYRDIQRRPFHVCAWRRAIADGLEFPDASYGEDWYWAENMCKRAMTEIHIDSVLHFYRFDNKVTEAEHVFPK
jgi:hypothetical protein